MWLNEAEDPSRRSISALRCEIDVAQDLSRPPRLSRPYNPHELALTPGTRLGVYEVTAQIGEGGMGQVYRAHDTKLDRDVAIKILPEAFAHDADRLARFQREAKTLASLNHPHIAAIYGLEESGNIAALVMELVEGEDLSQRVAHGAIPIDDVLPIAKQIAEALEAAHEQGIIHRDLKPANIKVRPDGTVKVLDFGLAKALGTGGGSEGTPTPVPTRSMSPTMTSPAQMSGVGVILGTAAYMAPEQAKGRAVDKRADIWAFGVVVYEMLTGRRLFAAADVPETLAAVLTRSVDVTALPAATPPQLQRLLARCLDRDPRMRLRDIGEARVEIEKMIAGVGENAIPSSSTVPAFQLDQDAARAVGRFRRLALAIAGAAAVALAVAAYLVLSRPISSGDVAWLSILPPPGGFDLSPDPAISPNGQYVLYKAQDASHRTHIYVKSLRSSDAHPIPRTDGTDFTAGAFWSPDSRSVGFFAQGKLKRVDIDGSSSQVLAAAPEPRGGTWSSSGVIVFNADTQNLMRVPAAGGAASRIADPSSGGVRLFPHALPGGDRYLFTSRNAGGQGQGVYVGSLSAPDVHRISDAWSPAVFANGYLLFSRQGGLFAQPLDLRRLQVVGEPREIADGVGVGCCTPLSYAFSASAGVVTYWGGSLNAITQLAWFDRAGKRVGVAGEPGLHIGFSVAPDEKRAAIERHDPASAMTDIWIVDLQRGAGSTRITFDGRFSVPVLTPSGDRMAVMERGRGIVTMPVGGGETEPLVASAASKWPVGWSHDGRVVTFVDTTPSGWRIWTATNRSGSAPSIYREAPFILSAPEISQDAKWLAYASDESGRSEVYVDSFPAPSTRSRVSVNGGAWPKWRSDGKELYYLAPDRRLMAVSVETGEAGLTFAPAVALFEGPGVIPEPDRTQFSPSRDGSRFLFNARIEDPIPAGLTVIINWPALVKK